MRRVQVVGKGRVGIKETVLDRCGSEDHLILRIGGEVWKYPLHTVVVEYN